MLELLISPKRAEREPWELFFVGLFYASLSILLTKWVFGDDLLAEYSGILVVTFTVMFSIPFMYYVIRFEERKVSEITGALNRLKSHRKAIWAFMWLFIGFVVAYSFWAILLSSTNLLEPQIGTYCAINRPDNVEGCVAQLGIKEGSVKTTQFATNPGERALMIITNNLYVLIFTLVFSLIFGAGVIFILAWNASVIAAAVGIFAKSDLGALPLALMRYFIHGIPEIAAYFVAALAGGIISIAVIRKDIETEKFWEILQDSLNLIIIAVVILFFAAVVEVFVTPIFFS